MSSARPGVVLDLDGTLVESAPDLMAALNVALLGAARAPVTLAAVKAMIGDGMPLLVERGFAATGGVPPAAELGAATRVCLDYYEAHATDRSRLFPGVLDTLETLRVAGHAFAVCTNKPYRAARRVLDAFDLSPLIDCVVGGDSLAYRKPDPRMLRATLAQLGADASHSVMVGDSLNDALVARGATVPFVFASFGYNSHSLEDLAPDATIDAFADLPAALQRV